MNAQQALTLISTDPQEGYTEAAEIVAARALLNK